MKTKVMAKLLLVGTFIVIAGYGLRGHELLIALVLSFLFLTVLAKVVFAMVARRRGGFPPRRGGSGPAGKPVPRPPTARPPALSASAQVGHGPTA